MICQMDQPKTDQEDKHDLKQFSWRKKVMFYM